MLQPEAARPQAGNPTLSAIQIASAHRAGVICIKEGGIRTEGSWQQSGGLLQPEAARPQAGNPTLSARIGLLF